MRRSIRCCSPFRQEQTRLPLRPRIVCSSELGSGWAPDSWTPRILSGFILKFKHDLCLWTQFYLRCPKWSGFLEPMFNFHNIILLRATIPYTYEAVSKPFYIKINLRFFMEKCDFRSIYGFIIEKRIWSKRCKFVQIKASVITTGTHYSWIMLKLFGTL